MLSHHRCQIEIARDPSRHFLRGFKSKIVRLVVFIHTSKPKTIMPTQARKKNSVQAVTSSRRHHRRNRVAVRRKNCKTTWQWCKATLKVLQGIKARHRLARALIPLHTKNQIIITYAALIKDISRQSPLEPWPQQVPRAAKKTQLITVKSSTLHYPNSIKQSKYRKRSNESKI